jgi:hypothetical protein
LDGGSITTKYSQIQPLPTVMPCDLLTVIAFATHKGIVST